MPLNYGAEPTYPKINKGNGIEMPLKGDAKKLEYNRLIREARKTLPIIENVERRIDIEYAKISCDLREYADKCKKDDDDDNIKKVLMRKLRSYIFLTDLYIQYIRDERRRYERRVDWKIRLLHFYSEMAKVLQHISNKTKDMDTQTGTTIAVEYPG